MSMCPTKDSFTALPLPLAANSFSGSVVDTSVALGRHSPLKSFQEFRPSICAGESISSFLGRTLLRETHPSNRVCPG